MKSSRRRRPTRGSRAKRPRPSPEEPEVEMEIFEAGCATEAAEPSTSAPGTFSSCSYLQEDSPPMSILPHDSPPRTFAPEYPDPDVSTPGDSEQPSASEEEIQSLIARLESTLNPETSTSGSLSGSRYGRPPATTKDPVWDFFETTADPDTRVCKLCGKTLSVKKSSKKGLATHIAMHTKEGLIADLKEVKGWLVPSLVCVSNIPCSRFNHPSMRVLFELARLGPVNEKIVRRLCDQESERVRGLLASDLTALGGNGTVFTLTADEWTWRRKRFLGVTLHASTIVPCWNSRSVEILARFRPRATAENLKESIVGTLAGLGLSVGNISGFTSDGAAVMIKVGKLLKNAASPSPLYHQLCLAHGVHLAVLDTFEASGPGDDEQDSWQVVGVEEPTLDEEECSEARDEETGEPPLFRGTAGELVNRVRDECSTFSRSPVLTDELLGISQRNGCQTKLVLDVRTRWSSTLRMLESFLALVESLRAFYGATRPVKPFPFSTVEISAIQGIAKALKSVAECVKRLSLAEATLLSSDLALQACLRKLRAEGTTFAEELRFNLCKRILQRRGVASRLARFIHEKAEETVLDGWLAAAKERALAEGEPAASFLDTGDIASEIARFQDSDQCGEAPTSQPPASVDPEDDYEIFMAASRAAMSQTRLNAVSAAEAMRLHTEGYQALPPRLIDVVTAVQPTSVPAERAFSKARHFRRYSQERQSDERYADYFILKDFYSKTRPWEAFLVSSSGQRS